MKNKTKKNRQYIPRIIPKISTSSKVFIDKKTRAKCRRNPNKHLLDD